MEKTTRHEKAACYHVMNRGRPQLALMYGRRRVGKTYLLGRNLDAKSGVGWAHAAQDSASPLLYVAAGGFTDRFREEATGARNEVYLWTLEDLYQPTV